MNTLEIISSIPAKALFVIWDNYDGTDNDQKFLNNPIGRAAAAKLYDSLNAPYKKIVYETPRGDVEVIKYIDEEYNAWLTA